MGRIENTFMIVLSQRREGRRGDFMAISWSVTIFNVWFLKKKTKRKYAIMLIFIISEFGHMDFHYISLSDFFHMFEIFYKKNIFKNLIRVEQHAENNKIKIRKDKLQKNSNFKSNRNPTNWIYTQ